MEKSKIYGYVRVSTEYQETVNQELEILRYCKDKKLSIDEIFSFVVSSRRKKEERGLDKLLKLVKKDDILIFASLSRLGRSTVEVISILRELNDMGVKVHLIKENMIIDINDPYQKMMITMIATVDELARDIISLNVREGIKGAKERGRVGGRRKGQKVSKKLDGKEEEIKKLLEMGVTRTKIAKDFGVTRPTLNNFIKDKEL